MKSIPDACRETANRERWHVVCELQLPSLSLLEDERGGEGSRDNTQKSGIAEHKFYYRRQALNTPPPTGII